MGRTNRHTAQFFLQKPGILPLEFFRYGVAHIGPALMAVQSPEESLFPVEIESVFFELRSPEANLYLLHIQHLADLQQGNTAGIADRMVTAPGLHHGAVDGNDTGRGEGFSHQLPLTFFQFHQNDTAGGIVQGGTDLQGIQIRCGDEEVFNVAFFLHIQPDFPIQAAVGQIIHHKAKGWDFTVLGGIQLHRQNIFFTQTGSFRDLHPEAGIAGAVMGQFHTVQINRGNMGSTVKLQEQVFFRQFRSQFQLPAITADHLIGVMVRIVLRALPHRMGQPDSGTHTFTVFKSGEPVCDKFPVVTKTPHNKASSMDVFFIIEHFLPNYNHKTQKTPAQPSRWKPFFRKRHFFRHVAETKKSSRFSGSFYIR